ncbi:MAG: formyltransferase family protein [Terrimicrobiaceae bacterium]
MKSIVVVGNGKVALDCVKIILKAIEPQTWRLACVAADSSRKEPTESLIQFCRTRNIDSGPVANINAAKFVGEMQALSPELVFSVNNFQIIRPALLATARRGFVNFHNAPLPKHAGSHACTWAIYEGETTHGVTWHRVDAGIDSGDIVAQRCFELPPDVTAIGLIMKCLVEGARLFEAVLPSLLRNEIQAVPQNQGARSFHAKKAVPNNGLLRLDWDYAQISRFVRSLFFHPFSNELAAAAIKCGDRVVLVDEVALVKPEAGGRCGEILALNESLCHFQCCDAVVALTKIRNADGQPIKPWDLVRQYGAVAGSFFTELNEPILPRPSDFSTLALSNS